MKSVIDVFEKYFFQDAFLNFQILLFKLSFICIPHSQHLVVISPWDKIFFNVKYCPSFARIFRQADLALTGQNYRRPGSIEMEYQLFKRKL